MAIASYGWHAQHMFGIWKSIVVVSTRNKDACLCMWYILYRTRMEPTKTTHCIRCMNNNDQHPIPKMIQQAWIRTIQLSITSQKKEEKHSYISHVIYVIIGDKMNENIDQPKQTKIKRKKGLMAIIYLNYG